MRRTPVLVDAMHIAASVFINDDERGSRFEHGKRLEALARIMSHIVV